MTQKILRTNKSGYMSDSFIDDEKKALEELGFDYTFSTQDTAISGADFLITSSDSKVEKWLEQGLIRDDQVILHPNSGFDNFPENFYLKSQAEVYLGLPIRAYPVAQTIIHFVLDSLGEVPKAKAWDKSRSWPRKLLKNQKILMIGLGHIGKIVGPTLRTLGSIVETWDPFHRLTPESSLKDFDIVILCCSLNESTRNLINKNSLSSFRSDITMINTSRGKCIDIDQLIEHAENHPEFKYALDVFPQEPTSNEIWDKLKTNCKTSHVAGVHDELDQEIIRFERRFFEKIAKGESPDLSTLRSRLIDKEPFTFYDILNQKEVTLKAPFYF